MLCHLIFLQPRLCQEFNHKQLLNNSLSTSHSQSQPHAIKLNHQLPPTAPNCHQLPPTDTNCHQQPPTDTNNHQKPPTDTNCHQLPPTTTNCHQLPPTATNCHQLTPTSTNHYQPLSTVTNFGGQNRYTLIQLNRYTLIQLNKTNNVTNIQKLFYTIMKTRNQRYTNDLIKLD